MSFVEIQTFQNKAKVNFLTLSTVQTQFQILDQHPHVMLVHTIRTSDGKFVKVLEKPNCPICSNPELKEKFHGPSFRYRVNVLNTTPHKTCPNCGAEYNMYRGNVARCTSCQADLTDVAALPINRVEILEKGKTVFTDINQHCEAMEVSNPNFDIRNLTFMATQIGTGRDTKVTLTPRTDIPAAPFAGYELYDLASVGDFDLSNDEVIALISGATLSAVLSSRSNSNQQNTPVDYAKSNSPAPFDFSGVPGLN